MSRCQTLVTRPGARFGSHGEFCGLTLGLQRCDLPALHYSKPAIWSGRRELFELTSSEVADATDAVGLGNAPECLVRF